jgi:threonyl-tRNA synthetase
VQVDSIVFTHKPPTRWQEHLGLAAVTALRKTFDWGTKYGVDMTESKYLQRFLYLETVAGVPGMVAGMLRHMRSLRSMKRDHGWIRTLLEEAENERMHLLTFLQLKEPSFAFRMMVLAGQGIVFNLYLLAYVISPRTCHAFVGYLEEQAVHTYTKAIEDLDAGRLPAWENRAAPDIAKVSRSKLGLQPSAAPPKALGASIT